MTAFRDESTLQALLDVEVALATAEAAAGLIPPTAVAHIRAAARAELYPLAPLRDEAGRAGNVVIPLVRQLSERVAARDPESARYVHYGATSQDIIDTALVLRLRASVPAIQESLARAIASAAALARAHATTPMAGRTLLQQASPTTFGLKAAGWLDMLARCRQRIEDALQRTLVVQLGGASGTLASLGGDGPAVIEAFARALALGVPDTPWHTHRDRIADVAAALGIACGALGKVGRDLTLLGQSEVGEAYETPAAGRGGSSSMPHKQNPVRAIAAVTAAIRAPGLVATMIAAMPQEQERAAGGWQAEWETLPELVQLATAAAEAMADALANLTIDPARMRANLDARGGVAMAEALALALSRHVPRGEAMRVVERLARTAEGEGRRLADVAGADAEIGRWLRQPEIERVLRPENYLGSAAVFVERTLRHWQV